MNTTPSGLQFTDSVVGDGDEAASGQFVTVHYTGWLYEDGEQGAKFDSSRDRNDPFEFSLGAGMVPVGGSPEDMARDMKKQFDAWGPIVKRIGFTAES